MNRFLGLCGLVFALVLTGCAKPVPYDYTAFKQSKPSPFWYCRRLTIPQM